MNKCFIISLIIISYSCNHSENTNQTLILHQDYEKIAPSLASKGLSTYIKSTPLDTMLFQLGYSTSALEFIGDTLVGYDKYLNKFFILSPEGELVSSFDLNFNNKTYSAFSYSYSKANSLLYVLDSKLNTVLGLTLSGKLIYDFPVPFAPLHIICVRNMILYYNPYPRNKYSTKYILCSTNLKGENYKKLLKIHPYPSSKHSINDISWITASGNTIKMYNKLLQRLIEYNTERDEYTVINLDISELSNIKILNFFLINSRPTIGLIIGTIENLFTPILVFLSSGKVSVLPATPKYPRLYWGIPLHNDVEIPFFPFQVMKNGTLYRIYSVHDSIGTDTNKTYCNYQILKYLK